MEKILFPFILCDRLTDQMRNHDKLGWRLDMPPIIQLEHYTRLQSHYTEKRAIMNYDLKINSTGCYEKWPIFF